MSTPSLSELASDVSGTQVIRPENHRKNSPQKP